MFEIKITSRFKKDYKKLEKQGKDLNLLSNLIDNYLIKDIPLPKENYDHALKGQYKDH